MELERTGFDQKLIVFDFHSAQKLVLEEMVPVEVSPRPQITTPERRPPGVTDCTFFVIFAHRLWLASFGILRGMGNEALATARNKPANP